MCAVTYICPVCGYPELEEAPADHNICPSCGTEFGYDDAVPTPTAVSQKWADLRWEWLQAGAPWFDPETPKPVGWNPVLQVLQAGLGHTTTSSSSDAEHKSVQLNHKIWKVLDFDQRHLDYSTGSTGLIRPKEIRVA